ncbi:MAG: hypothetical protein JSV92_00515, partial [archaeon]
MIIKTREKVFGELKKKGKREPENWKYAICNNPQLGIFEHYFLNPKVGVYQLTEWWKNPYEVVGV